MVHKLQKAGFSNDRRLLQSVKLNNQIHSDVEFCSVQSTSLPYTINCMAHITTNPAMCLHCKRAKIEDTKLRVNLIYEQYNRPEKNIKFNI